MTFPQIMQSISDNNLTLVISKLDKGVKCEMSRTKGDNILSIRFKATHTQFPLITTSIEEMIKNLMEQ